MQVSQGGKGQSAVIEWWKGALRPCAVLSLLVHSDEVNMHSRGTVRSLSGMAVEQHMCGMKSTVSKRVEEFQDSTGAYPFPCTVDPPWLSPIGCGVVCPTS